MHHLTTTKTWPPAYKLKRHRLARHVKLRVTQSHGLEITIPVRFNIRQIPAVLEEHQQWIQQQLYQLDLQPMDELPSVLTLTALQKTWCIRYLACRSRLKIMEQPQGDLVLLGNLDDKAQCKAKLVEWVKRRAAEYLVGRLQKISAQIHLSYQSVTIRGQKTLWGSCTIHKAINLNYRLIFLPENLVDHIIIHELCHTQHLNHSSHFWLLVAKNDKDWEIHRTELRRADKWIPAWISR